MPLENPALVFTLAMAVGIAAQIAAARLRVPAIVVLLLSGVLLGPEVAGLIRPRALGARLDDIVGLAVAVILFEGGMGLNLHRVRNEARPIRRLITLGAGISTVGGTLAAHLFLGWPWPMALLFGTLAVITGPTVINPLLRRIRVRSDIATILETEGVFLDPIGAIVAVVMLEIVLARTSGGAAAGLLGLPSRLGLGLLAGALGGYLLARILRSERLVPAGLENVFTLAMVLALFEITNAVKPDTGILAVTVAGMIVGNLDSRIGRELHDFKEQLTLLLVGMIFVVLAADVELTSIVALGWGGAATVLALMLVVRPAGVWASTTGTDLGWRGRAFIAWLGPRGIVVAAVATLFARRLAAAGSDYGDPFRALVFLVIGATVVIQGLSAGWMAGRLGVRRCSEQGFAIVGANPLARAVARLLAKWGEEVVLVDSNPTHTAAAEREGLTVIYGNANEEPVFLRADVAGRRGFIACTPNEGANVLLAEKARREYRVTESYALVQQETAGVTSERAADTGARILFGTPVDFDAWAQALRSGRAEEEVLTFAGEEEEALFEGEEDPPREERSPARLAVAVRRGEEATPVSERTLLHPGDAVAFLLQPGDLPSAPPPGPWRAEVDRPLEDRSKETVD